MSLHPILLIGGSGMVGQWTARHLRTAYPDVPILIGGRDIVKARGIAAELGNCEGVTVDLTAEDLGLHGRQVSAAALFFTDASLAVMRFAQARGVPYIGISTALHAIGPEVANFVHRPNDSAVVLGTEWLVGATTVPALKFAKDFRRVYDVRIGALVDEQDTGGPEQSLDHDRAVATRPAALSRRDGNYVWRAGEEAGGHFRTVDGAEVEGFALSLVDIVGLATETDASNVQLNLAVGMSSTRRREEGMSTEIIIEMAGEDHRGEPLRSRHAVIYPGGQLPLTGLGVAMLVERLVGLDGGPSIRPGLYFPYQVLDHTAYLARLKQTGGQILKLDVG